MKKQLSLLALLALSTPIAFAGSLELGQVFDNQHGFGYTENQNIMVDGFQTKDELSPAEFVMRTPILKNAVDEVVGDYYILLGEKPLANYVSGEEALQLRDQLIELPVYSTMDLEGELELPITENILTNASANSGTTYFGIVVPVDDNVLYGKSSKEFCFNFADQKYSEGQGCLDFVQPQPVQVATTDEVISQSDVYQDDEEHNAAGADMRLADISHSVQGNVITLTWTAVPSSENVEIKLFDKQLADYTTLATVPMSQERFEYVYNDDTEEFLFAFIPRDSKGKEVRYDVNVRHEVEATPEITTPPKVGPVEDMLMILGFTVLLYVGYSVVSSKRAAR